MTNHEGIATTFIIDPDLGPLPLDTCIKLVTNIQRLAVLGQQFCVDRSKTEEGIEIDDWPEVGELFSTLETDADLLHALLTRYYKMHCKPAADGIN